MWAWKMQRRLEKGQQHIPLTMLYVAGRGMTTTSTQSTCTSEQLYCWDHASLGVLPPGV